MILRNLLDPSATVELAARHVTVSPEKRAHNTYLIAPRLLDIQTQMPYFGNKRLAISFA